MIHQLYPAQSPDDMIARLQKLYEQCPTAMVTFLTWIETTPYGSITLRFSDGVLQMVERTETAK
jgi:hypothetical protein